MGVVPDYDPEGFDWPKPPAPPKDWWLAKGVQFGLVDDAEIRLAAALWSMGGRGGKQNNALAAKLAGLSGSRQVAFRIASSARVRNFLAEVDKRIKGEAPDLTEKEVDREVAWCVRHKDPSIKAKGIEIY